MATEYLRRYTSLASALHVLQTRSLTLLSPEKWDDRNDRNFMAAYGRTQKASSILALCFSEAGETYCYDPR